MQRGPALQSCFTLDHAFGSGDRVHRVAAIHHALPQLRISVNDEGYLEALGDFEEPVGPAFWERG